MEQFYWNTCYSREPMAYLVLQLEFTIVLLVVLAIASGVTGSLLIVTHSKLKKLERENKRLTFYLEQLRKTINNMREQGITTNIQNNSPRSMNIDMKILELYSKGYSLRQIAREVGLSHTTVHRRLKKLLGRENRTLSSTNHVIIETPV